MFDFAVNSGSGRAVKFPQALLKARKLYGGELDGGLGAKTLDALRGVTDIPRLVGDLSAMRLKYLKSLDNWPHFKNGWTRRVAEVQAVAARMARLAPSVAVPVAAIAALPEPAPSSRGAEVAVSRTLPGKVAILSVASAVGEQASEYASTFSGLQDIAPVFKWIFVVFTVLGVLAGLAKAIQSRRATAISRGSRAPPAPRIRSGPRSRPSPPRQIRSPRRRPSPHPSRRSPSRPRTCPSCRASRSRSPPPPRRPRRSRPRPSS